MANDYDKPLTHGTLGVNGTRSYGRIPYCYRASP